MLFSIMPVCKQISPIWILPAWWYRSRPPMGASTGGPLPRRRLKHMIHTPAADPLHWVAQSRVQGRGRHPQLTIPPQAALPTHPQEAMRTFRKERLASNSSVPRRPAPHRGGMAPHRGGMAPHRGGMAPHDRKLHCDASKKAHSIHGMRCETTL